MKLELARSVAAIMAAAALLWIAASIGHFVNHGCVIRVQHFTGVY